VDKSVNRLCTICARGGSKGVKNKNLRMLLGRPLLAYSLIQARKCGLFSVIAVSSDSEAILQVASENGADVLISRPKEMATDTAGKLPAIRHCVLSVEEQLGLHFDQIVDLDCTSPLRLTADILGAVYLLETTDSSNIVTGSYARRSPYFNLLEERPDKTITLSKQESIGLVLRRQDAPRCFDMNASIYVWKRDALLEHDSLFQTTTRLYEMPEERSLDIDSELDFELVEYIAKQRKRFQDIW
jgi:CMP-N,N'-diacetyllegionaminic acid synthase